MGLVRAIDVSRHQGTIDWSAVRASGVQGAWIKVVPMFPRNVIPDGQRLIRDRGQNGERSWLSAALRPR